MKKKIILAAAISVFSVTATFAQTEPAKPERKERTERRGDMQRNPMADLKLSQAQDKQMKTIADEGRTKAEAIRNNASLSDEQKRTQMMELRKALHEKRMAVLTPEQKKQWEEQAKERGNRDRNGEKRGAKADKKS